MLNPGLGGGTPVVSDTVCEAPKGMFFEVSKMHCEGRKLKWMLK